MLERNFAHSLSRSCRNESVVSTLILADLVKVGREDRTSIEIVNFDFNDG
ncbi:hypothetical protein GALL_536440 [mine drainage metagenome]|uniref:Uncharacterized protein n=1 Tax=mine drainage metagenome TaxID=410659 RepID=A0A1J5PBE4_9ZZZZ